MLPCPNPNRLHRRCSRGSGFWLARPLRVHALEASGSGTAGQAGRGCRRRRRSPQLSSPSIYSFLVQQFNSYANPGGAGRGVGVGGGVREARDITANNPVLPLMVVGSLAAAGFAVSGALRLMQTDLSCGERGRG